MTPKFLVASTGRAGSKYVAEVLTACGLPCGHEQWWNPTGERDDSIVGDSSWWAVRDLATIDVPIVHLVRHPLRVVSSLLEEGVGGPCETPYTWRRREIAGGWSGHDLLDAVRIVVRMNETIERYACERWQVEELSPLAIARLATLVGAIDVSLSVAHAANVLAAVPRDVNDHGVQRQYDWHELPWTWDVDALVNQARRYGYVE